MGKRAANKPVDHVPAIAMSNAISFATSHYKEGMLMALTVCATASTLPSDDMRDEYIRDMFAALPEDVEEGAHRDDYTWGFYQMVEILHGALMNISGPELLKMPPASQN